MTSEEIFDKVKEIIIEHKGNFKTFTASPSFTILTFVKVFNSASIFLYELISNRLSPVYIIPFFEIYYIWVLLNYLGHILNYRGDSLNYLRDNLNYLGDNF